VSDAGMSNTSGNAQGLRQRREGQSSLDLNLAEHEPDWQEEEEEEKVEDPEDAEKAETLLSEGTHGLKRRETKRCFGMYSSVVYEDLPDLPSRNIVGMSMNNPLRQKACRYHITSVLVLGRYFAIF
jgi:hypothetical protein